MASSPSKSAFKGLSRSSFISCCIKSLSTSEITASPLRSPSMMDPSGQRQAFGFLFDILDTNHDGSVDLSELSAGLTVLCGGGDPATKVLSSFQLQDLDGDGVVTPEELFMYLSSMFRVILAINPEAAKKVDSSVTAEEIAVATTEKCFQEADRNGDGKITFDEFLAWYQVDSPSATVSSHESEKDDGDEENLYLYDDLHHTYITQPHLLASSSSSLEEDEDEEEEEDDSRNIITLAKKWMQLSKHSTSSVIKNFSEFVDDDNQLSKRDFLNACIALCNKSEIEKNMEEVYDTLTFLFEVFDTNEDEVIDLKELAAGLSVLCGRDSASTATSVLGSPSTAHKKMEHIFKMYDLNGDGYIQPEEMEILLTSIFRILFAENPSYSKGLDGVTPEMIAQATTVCAFEEADLNHDGEISAEEFTTWFLQHNKDSAFPFSASAGGEASDSIYDIIVSAATLDDARTQTGIAAVSHKKVIGSMSAVSEAEGLTRGQFIMAIVQAGGKDSEVDTEMLGKVFDLFGEDQVPLPSLAAAIAMLSGGSRKERAVTSFQLFDQDGDGYIDEDEMNVYLCAIFRIILATNAEIRKSLPGVSPEEIASATTSRCMEEADLNHDGKISLAEFIKWCETSPMGAKDTDTDDEEEEEEEEEEDTFGEEDIAGFRSKLDLMFDFNDCNAVDVIQEFVRNAESETLSKEVFIECMMDHVKKIRTAASADFHEISAYEICEVLFALFDSNHDGTVDIEELVAGISTLCRGDAVDDGELSRSELLEQKKLRAKAIFDLFDYDGNGFIDQDEMTSYMASVFRVILATDVDSFRKSGGANAHEIAVETARLCMADADSNGDGFISFEEFFKWFYGDQHYDDAAHDLAESAVHEIVTIAADSSSKHLTRGTRESKTATDDDSVDKETTLEFIRKVTRLGSIPLERLLQTFVSLAKKHDSSGDPYLSHAEFNQAISMLVGKQSQADKEASRFHLAKLFTIFDSNDDGVVSVDELIAGLSVLCDGSKHERMRIIFQQLAKRESSEVVKTDTLVISSRDYISFDALVALLASVFKTVLSLDGNIRSALPGAITPEDLARETAIHCFQDLNGADRVSADDFVQWMVSESGGGEDQYEEVSYQPRTSVPAKRLRGESIGVEGEESKSKKIVPPLSTPVPLGKVSLDQIQASCGLKSVKPKIFAEMMFSSMDSEMTIGYSRFADVFLRVVSSLIDIPSGKALSSVILPSIFAAFSNIPGTTNGKANIRELVSGVLFLCGSLRDEHILLAFACMKATPKGWSYENVRVEDISSVLTNLFKALSAVSRNAAVDTSSISYLVQHTLCKLIAEIGVRSLSQLITPSIVAHWMILHFSQIADSVLNQSFSFGGESLSSSSSATAVFDGERRKIRVMESPTSSPSGGPVPVAIPVRFSEEPESRSRSSVAKFSLGIPVATPIPLSSSAAPSSSSSASMAASAMISPMTFKLLGFESATPSEIFIHFASFADANGKLSSGAFEAACKHFRHRLSYDVLSELKDHSHDVRSTAEEVMFIKSLFDMFDSNHEGSVDVADIVAGLTVLCGEGDFNAKIETAFYVYDFNGDGVIIPEEMVTYLTSVFCVLFVASPELAATAKCSPEVLAIRTANQCFDQADLDRDGKLTMKEFQNWCKDHAGSKLSPVKSMVVAAATDIQISSSASSSTAASLLAAIRQGTTLPTTDLDTVVRAFSREARHDGTLDRPGFNRAMAQFVKKSKSSSSSYALNPVDTLILHGKLFDIFDADHNGHVDPRELAAGLTIMCHGLDMSDGKSSSSSGSSSSRSTSTAGRVIVGHPEESRASSDRVRALFSLFDRNGDGYITPSELVACLHAIFAARVASDSDFAKASQHTTALELAETAAAQCFEEADSNRDGKLSFEEFRHWYTQSVQHPDVSITEARNISGLGTVDVVNALQFFQKYQAVSAGHMLTLDVFLKLCQQLTPGLPSKDRDSQQELLCHIFNAFDLDHNGFVDRTELSIGLIVLCGGTPERRVQASFRVFDINRDGFVSYDEMYTVLLSIFKVCLALSPDFKSKASGLSPQTLAEATTAEAFQDLHLERDDVLSCDDFSVWYIGHYYPSKPETVTSSSSSSVAVSAPKSSSSLVLSSDTAVPVSTSTSLDNISSLVSGGLSTLAVATHLSTIPSKTVIKAFSEGKSSLSLSDFQSAYHRLLVSAGIPKSDGAFSASVSKSLFSLFDRDRNGTVDAKECALGTMLLSAGDARQKTKAAFCSLDNNGDGLIDYEEMKSYLEAIFSMMFAVSPLLSASLAGISPAQIAEATAAQCMQEADLNQDGTIDPEEFGKWYCQEMKMDYDDLLEEDADADDDNDEIISESEGEKEEGFYEPTNYFPSVSVSEMFDSIAEIAMDQRQVSCHHLTRKMCQLHELALSPADPSVEFISDISSLLRAADPVDMGRIPVVSAFTIGCILFGLAPETILVLVAGRIASVIENEGEGDALAISESNLSCIIECLHAASLSTNLPLNISDEDDEEDGESYLVARNFAKSVLDHAGSAVILVPMSHGVNRFIETEYLKKISLS